MLDVWFAASKVGASDDVEGWTGKTSGMGYKLEDAALGVHGVAGLSLMGVHKGELKGGPGLMKSMMGDVWGVLELEEETLVWSCGRLSFSPLDLGM